MSKITYYKRNGNVILNRARDYYKIDKERLRNNARDKDRNLSKQEKKKRENTDEIDIILCQKIKNKN